MLEEEEEHEWFIPARDLPQTMDQIQDQLNDLVISDSSSLEDLVVSTWLNLFNQASFFKCYLCFFDKSLKEELSACQSKPLLFVLA